MEIELDKQNLEKKIKLEMLITEREGMIAENKSREYFGQSPAYWEDSFAILLEKMSKLL
jgi:hypothetical protein